MAIFDRNYDRDFGNRGGMGYQGSDRGIGDRMRQSWNRAKEGARDAMDRDDDRGGYGYRGGAWGGESHLGRDNMMGRSGYDRDMGGAGYNNSGYGYGAGGGNWQRESLNRLEGNNRDLYDRDSDWYAGRAPGMGMGAGMGSSNRSYDRDFDRGNGFGASSDMDRGYDRDHKGRWQTDNGDPFGDRASGTPIRMMRGGFGHNEDRGGMMGGGSNYDRDFGRGYGAGSNMSYDRDMRDRGGMMGRGSMDDDRTYMHGLGYDPYDGDDMNRGRSGGTWGMQGQQNRNRGGYDRGWF
ncbi:MAG TPA: hypothetical protein VF615_10270 [Longimicrobiaceae bacterium]|jgi:hypothetical protein